MKRAVKSNNMLSFGVIARQLDGRFDRLGAGFGEKDFFLRGSRSDSTEFFCQVDHRLVVIIAAANVQKLVRLLFDSLYHSRMRVPRARDGDTRHEIEKQIAVYVFDHHAAPLLDD